MVVHIYHNLALAKKWKSFYIFTVMISTTFGVLNLINVTSITFILSNTILLHFAIDNTVIFNYIAISAFLKYFYWSIVILYLLRFWRFILAIVHLGHITHVTNIWGTVYTSIHLFWRVSEISFQHFGACCLSYESCFHLSLLILYHLIAPLYPITVIWKWRNESKEKTYYISFFYNDIGPT